MEFAFEDVKYLNSRRLRLVVAFALDKALNTTLPIEVNVKVTTTGGVSRAICRVMSHLDEGKLRDQGGTHTPSGGPFYTAQEVCRVTGIDANEHGVVAATQIAVRFDHSDRVRFTVADATARLPFDDQTFDAVLCIDSMNHFPDRLKVFQEWRRVLRPGRIGLPVKEGLQELHT